MLHTTALLRLCATHLHIQYPLELVFGRTPNVSHLRTFGWRVWIPIPEPQKKTIGTHRQKGIYVGYDSPSIICYLSILTGILLRDFLNSQNSHFDETSFPSLPNTKNASILDFFALQTFIHNRDLHTALSKQEVQKLVSLKALANKLPDGFSNTPRITRDPVPGAGLPSLQILPRKRKAEILHSDVQALEPTSLDEAKKSLEWPQWSIALQAEYNSFQRHQIFGLLVPNLRTKPMEHKLIFTEK